MSEYKKLKDKLSEKISDKRNLIKSENQRIEEIETELDLRADTEWYKFKEKKEIKSLKKEQDELKQSRSRRKLGVLMAVFSMIIVSVIFIGSANEKAGNKAVRYEYDRTFSTTQSTSRVSYETKNDELTDEIYFENTEKSEENYTEESTEQTSKYDDSDGAAVVPIVGIAEIKTTEKATENTTKKATEKTTEKAKDKVTEKTTEKSTANTTEKVTEEATEKTSKKPTEKETKTTTKKATEKKKDKKSVKNNVTESETESKDKSRIVYITPTGKRYHFISTCGGENSYDVTLSEAKAKGLTPCKKCAS